MAFNPYQEVTYEAALSAELENFTRLFPTWDGSTSSPLYAIIKSIANAKSRYAMLGNEVLSRSYPGLAEGIYKDQLYGGALNIPRKADETDSEYEARKNLLMLTRDSGSDDYYDRIMKDFNEDVKQIVQAGLVPNFNFHILKKSNEALTATERTEMLEFLERGDTGQSGINFNIANPSVAIASYTISATIKYDSGALFSDNTPITAALLDAKVRPSIYAEIDYQARINRLLSVSRLLGALRVDGVYDIDSFTPDTDKVALPGIAYVCQQNATDVVLTYTDIA